MSQIRRYINEGDIDSANELKIDFLADNLGITLLKQSEVFGNQSNYSSSAMLYYGAGKYVIRWMTQVYEYDGYVGGGY